MSGTLFLCATPIGNLSDITERVKLTLNEVDIVACEDTRNSLKLMNAFDVHTPLTSYHEFNKFDKAYTLIEKLREGKNVALITDAGTPAISDPGEVLVRMCLDEGIHVTSLPGACALITALTLSGLPTRRFCFEGFLPFEKKERRKILKEIEDESRTTIMYEAPHRLRQTLSELRNVCGDKRNIVLCRELTKKFEEVLRFTLSEAENYYETTEPKGEYVLVLDGKSEEEKQMETARSFENMTINEHMKIYEDKGIDHKEAMKMVAKDRGITKREVYSMLLEDKNEI